MFGPTAVLDSCQSVSKDLLSFFFFLLRDLGIDPGMVRHDNLFYIQIQNRLVAVSSKRLFGLRDHVGGDTSDK